MKNNLDKPFAYFLDQHPEFSDLIDIQNGYFDVFDEVDRLIELYLAIKQVFEVTEGLEPIVQATVERLEEDIIDTRYEQMIEAYKEKVKQDIEDSDITHIRNYFLRLKTNFPSGTLESEHEDIIYGEFKFGRFQHPVELQGKLHAIAIPAIYRDIKKQYNFYKNYDDSQSGQLVTKQEDLLYRQKVLFLHELGVFKHLNQRYNLQGKFLPLARIVSIITGDNSDTLRRYINSLYSEGDSNTESDTPETRQWLTETLHNLKLEQINESTEKKYFIKE